MRLLWLPDVLREAGLDVYEMPGWETRGISRFNPQGLVAHHTATSAAWQDGHVAFLLRDGRRDLPGPLSQTGLERDGTWVIVASGRANHNGYGLWGNDSIGVEAYNDGIGEPWPPAQIIAYQRGVAAICRHLGWGADRVKGHKETDPKRKIDPTFSMTLFRSVVAGLIIGSNVPQEDALMALSDKEAEALRQQVNDLHFSLVGARKFGGDPRDHDLATPILDGYHRIRQLEAQALAAAIADALPDGVDLDTDAVAEAVLDGLADRLVS